MDMKAPSSQSRQYRAGCAQTVNSWVLSCTGRPVVPKATSMAHGTPPLSAEITAALAVHADATPATLQRLQVGLARLVLPQAPPAATFQLDLALAFIEGRASAADLKEAKQDCWTYVGSLACGCSVADSASAHAILSCLEADAAAHTPAVLAEQVHKVLRCGVEQSTILALLRA